jgi:flagellar hook assembly protein FlgD
LPAAQWVSLGIYSCTGQLVRTLTANQYTAGVFIVSWDGCDNAGGAVASGVYLCRLSGPDQATGGVGRTLTTKMLLLR